MKRIDEKIDAMSELIYDPNKNAGPMNVVAFGSGSCSTIEKMLEYQHILDQIPGEDGFRITALVTNSKRSRAHEISRREGIPLIYNNLWSFVREQGLDPKVKANRDLPEIRTAFDENTKDLLLQAAEQNKFSIDLVALAGYMLIVQKPLLDHFSGRMINSHPADLSILNPDGTPKYTGDDAVFDAIIAEEEVTRTSIHIARKKVDQGEILVLSRPLKVDTDGMSELYRTCKYVDKHTQELFLQQDYTARKVPEEEQEFSLDAFCRMRARKIGWVGLHQELQKERCDYPAYLFTIEEIANGKFSLEGEEEKLKTVLYDGERMPYRGVRLDDLKKT